ncbi:hypothetical protein Tco_0579287 [Tanacetum coccineum]
MRLRCLRFVYHFCAARRLDLPQNRETFMDLPDMIDGSRIARRLERRMRSSISQLDDTRGGARLSRAAWRSIMDACVQTRSGHITSDYGPWLSKSRSMSCRHSDRREEQTVITDSAESAPEYGRRAHLSHSLPEEASSKVLRLGMIVRYVQSVKYYGLFTAETGHRRCGRLSQWFERMEKVLSHKTVTNDIAYAMTWTDLKKKMTTNIVRGRKSRAVDADCGNLKVKTGTECGSFYNSTSSRNIALLCDRDVP